MTDQSGTASTEENTSELARLRALVFDRGEQLARAWAVGVAGIMRCSPGRKTAVTERVEDGYGNAWEKCLRPDCSLQIVRPGKVQCDDDWVDGEFGPEPVSPCMWEKPSCGR
jgi:hypothetical protein